MIGALLPLLLPLSASAESRLVVTPAEIRTTPTRALAERLVERVRRECDEGGTGAAPAAGARLVMLVPLADFPAIARFGFLNRHLTRAAGGADELAERFEAEQELALARLPYDLHGRELLPKYAILDAPDRGLGRFLLPRRRGEAAVVFKPEVAARATWTYGGGDANRARPHTFAYRRKPGDRGRCAGYCEAQIWGELNLSDVESLLIPRGAKVPVGAASAGLRVYRYAVPASTSAADAPARTAVYVRGPAVRVSTGPEVLPTPAEYRARPELAGLRVGFEEARLDDDAAARRLAASRDPDERLRLTGVLAARAKTPGVIAALESALRDDGAATRAQALYGLGEAPWERFKPALLAALKDSDRRVRVQAAAHAADHRDDADVAAALAAAKAAAEARASDVGAADELEWLSRPDRPRLCGPAAPDR